MKVLNFSEKSGLGWVFEVSFWVFYVGFGVVFSLGGKEFWFVCLFVFPNNVTYGFGCWQVGGRGVRMSHRNKYSSFCFVS